MTRGWDDFTERDLARIEAATLEVGRTIFAQRARALPMLKTSASVTRHLHEYFYEVDRHLPGAEVSAIQLWPMESF